MDGVPNSNIKEVDLLVAQLSRPNISDVGGRRTRPGAIIPPGRFGLADRPLAGTLGKRAGSPCL